PKTQILIPTGFSPNGDGVNDIFRIMQPTLNLKTLLEFSVYNRWGEKVFSTSDVTEGWNGTFKGTAQEMAVYAWYLVGKTYDGEDVFKKGNVGIVSKSGTLTYEAADQIVKAGLGITTAIGIGGDPIIGTTTRDAVKLLMADKETEGIVMIGEIGGNLEALAAEWVKANGTKPVVGFIAGETAPKGRTMGHAGAIVGGENDTAEAKKRILRACGIRVVDSPAEIGKAMAEELKKVMA
ncbi:MAG: gliding motility-associated C-terminal domain-containing protein, partial [Bacteroidetes bacterium]|nr:gliding motility-associated C-terminal domain-containing protein [Bacteroidota bacterium]